MDYPTRIVTFRDYHCESKATINSQSQNSAWKQNKVSTWGDLFVKTIGTTFLL